ncbi:MAG TPA: molybdopterin-dependent oxidoreductase [Stellaceae bacterium]|nr:molybdopterin-dependent oxidoreductase [Stellaceae bacterium]
MAIFPQTAATILAGLLLIAPAAAQSPAAAPVLSLQGKVKQAQHWTFDDLKKMRAEHADVSYQTEHGPVTASYTGVLLWSLIDQAGGIDDGTRNAVVRHTIRITATDGYVIILSTGEMSPDYGNARVLVAYERDGKPLDNFRVVIPGDKRGARDVHDVTTIAVE